MNFKPTKETITLHGLGFMQVKLGGNMRLNVWHPELPRRSCFKSSSIHDHRFGFTSRVLIGTQVNQYYRSLQRREGVTASHFGYLHEGERTKFGNRPWLLDSGVRLEKVGLEEIIGEGEDYHVSPYIPHSTNCEGICVTLMTKHTQHNKGSHSYCETNIDPDVDFDRKQWSEDRLLELFAECMKNV